MAAAPSRTRQGILLVVIAAAGCQKAAEPGEGAPPESVFDPVGTRPPVIDWQGSGDVQVRIDRVRIGAPRTRELSTQRPEPTRETYLVVTYSVWNKSQTRKLEYFRPRNSFGATARLTDEHGNDYSLHTFTTGTHVDGYAGSGTLQPGQYTRDSLCFQKPVAAANELRLKITPGWASPGGDEFTFQRSAWEK